MAQVTSKEKEVMSIYARDPLDFMIKMTMARKGIFSSKQHIRRQNASTAAIKTRGRSKLKEEKREGASTSPYANEHDIRGYFRPQNYTPSASSKGSR